MSKDLPHILNHCPGCEDSYRRGVHQAYVALRQYLETHGGSPMAALRGFEGVAYEYRHDDKKHPVLLAELAEQVKGK